MRRLSLILLLSLCFAGLDTFGQSAQPPVASKKTVSEVFYYGEDSLQLVEKEKRPIYMRSTPQKCFNCQSVHSGDGTFSCATLESEEILRKKYPGKASIEQFEAFISRNKKSSSGLRSENAIDLYVIPVIVHVIYYEGQAVGVDHNITAGQVLSQIEVLNEDYQKKINTRGYNVDPVGANARIEFVPALYDPQGNLLPEPGIHRVKAEDITDGEYFLDANSRFLNTGTASWIKAQTSWEPNCYLNLWTMGLANGVLGFAVFPDTNLPGVAGLELPDPQYDGVVIDYRRFGSYEKGPFPGAAQSSMGRAASHEIGHFLGLRHTWGDAPSDSYGQYPEGCSYDDYVDDTPNVKQPMYVNKPLYLCGAREMIENQMDYSSDFVKNVFTVEQVERMHTVLENSPRRKQLLSSTVAQTDGEKTPIVTLSASSKQLHVFDIFAFEAIVERFPGSYQWEFQDGIPATSTERTPGVYFDTPGKKQIKLTVHNKYGSVTKVTTIDVVENKSCDVLYSTTLATLPQLLPVFSFGGYMTGHGDLFGVKYIANQFTLSDDPSLQYITQLEMDYARFITKPTFNPDTTFTVYVTTQSYDSIRINKTSTSDNYQIISSPCVDIPEGGIEVRSVSAEVRDMIIGKLKASSDLAYDIEENANYFICKCIRPGKVLAKQKIRVGDALRAFQNDKPLRIVLDNPIRPETKNYFLVLDTDYDYFLPRKDYAFDLKAGLSPVNFCWGKAITQETVQITYPNQWTYEWAPFTLAGNYNGWDVKALMHFLPVFSATNDAIPLPEFEVPELIDPGTKVNLKAPQTLPAGVTSYKWTVRQPDGKIITKEGQNTEFTFTDAGLYDIILSYIGKDCLVRSTTHQIKVRGIKFTITTSEEGYPIYCPGKRVRFTINETTKTGTVITYKWYGGGLNGETGLTQRIPINETTTIRVEAEDNSGAKASQTVTIELNSKPPVSKFKVLNAHLQRGDTLDIYIADDMEGLNIDNQSENVSHFFNASGVLTRDFKWTVKGYGLKSFINENSSYNTSVYNLNQTLTTMASGPGLYRLGLEVANRGCSTSSGPVIAESGVMKDTSFVYLNFMAQSSFGELNFLSNGKKMNTAPPPAYPSFYGYSSYMEPGGSISLEAISNEITDIKWTNDYSGAVYNGKKVELTDVRDNLSFTVDITRSRDSKDGHIDFKEKLFVLVLMEEKAPTEKAVATFRPHLDSICAGTVVKFINSSKNTTSFEWVFDGGVPAEDEKNFDLSNFWAPNRRYDQPGEYKVKLNVTSFDGSVSSMEHTIHVGKKVNNPSLKFTTSSSPSRARVVNDTIYTYDRGTFMLVVEGVGIQEILKYDTYMYVNNEWKWTDSEAKKNKLFRPSFTIFTAYNGPTYPAQDGLQRIQIHALTCNGDTLRKEIYLKLTFFPSIDNYSLEINGSPQILENIANLQTQVSCAGAPVVLEVKSKNQEVQDGTDIYWYELNENGVRTKLLSRDFKTTVSPTINTTYEVTFVNKIGEGFTYKIPVQVGISGNQLRVMNIDLAMNSNHVIELPRAYNTQVILWVDDVVKPTWNKEGNSLILSSENALVVPPADGVYEVKANSINGECTYSGKITIKTTPEPDPDPNPEPDPGDDMSEIKMYPIPARDILTIENPYSGTAYIIDGLGKMIESRQLKPGTVQLSVKKYAAGVYTLVVRFGKDKDEKIISRNFVVVH